MPNVRLAISGSSDGLAIVRPLVPLLEGAFLPFGISLLPENGIELTQDPEQQAGGWTNLVARLEQQSHGSTPAHLVITHAPPEFDLSINGMLLDTSVRGVVAVYLDSNIYGPEGPGRRADLVSQVCIHELGHLFDLTHSDGGSDTYSNAMLPASSRQNQTVSVAWQAAMADAQSRGEPAVRPPNPVMYYPFGAQCRACLRAASSDPRWLPFGGPFRGNYEGAGASQDRSVEIQAFPDPNVKSSYVAGGLYFSLAIKNRASHPLEIPAHISPEHGSMRVVAVNETSGERVLHYPHKIVCSDARRTLMPGDQIVRNFALLGTRPLFAKAGRYSCLVELIDHQRAVRAELARTSMTLDILPDDREEQLGRWATKLISQPRTKRRHERPAEEALASVAGNHVLLLLARREIRKKARLDSLQSLLGERVPMAIRHQAVREIALSQIRSGKDWHAVIDSMRAHLEGVENEELREAVVSMGAGWSRYREVHRS